MKASEEWYIISPAEVRKYRFEEEKIAELQEMKWWNWDEERLRSLVGKEG
ncbi:MAG: hypothetical protein MJZ84_02245 [Paludibacteraceae bacterium]|nr:hypothetical protein [Paludibacteraceae bacterium]